MGKKVRCPICGMVVWSSQVNKFHEIEILELKRSVRAKGSGGFRYTESFDQGLVALVKAKIKTLYERFFPESKIQLEIPTISRVLYPARTELTLNPSILVKTGVKVVG